MNTINEKIQHIAADTTRSVQDRVGDIVELHQTVKPDSDEFFQVGVTAYEAIRRMLLQDNYEDCHMGDLLMCNALLSESYWRVQKGWLIAPLAQHSYDMMLGVTTSDEESLKTMIAVIDRLCYVLTNSGHPRLMMKLYALQYDFIKQLPTPNELALKDTAEELVTLAQLSQCDTWLSPLKEEITNLLGEQQVQEIINNPHTGFLKTDPVEYSEEYEDIIDSIDAEIDRRMEGQVRGMGACFEIWSIKKELLASHGIEWRSPASMNPKVHFD